MILPGAGNKAQKLAATDSASIRETWNVGLVFNLAYLIPSNSIGRH